MPYAKANDGTPIFFNDWGSGRPVVLIHGWPLNGDSWEYQSVPLVEAGFRVVTPDRRGFGRSGHPWTGYDYDTMAGDVAAVIEELNLNDVVLVGFSMGGGEVARIAGSGNPRVGKAVFLSAVTPFLMRTGDNPEGVDPGIFEQMTGGLRDDRPGFLGQFGKSFFGSTLFGGASVPDGIQNWTMMMAMAGSPRATLECVKAFSATDFRADLRRIAVPTLVIHGTGDKTVPIEASGHRTASMVRGAELIEYPGAPHAVFFTERERLTADLIAFAR